MEVSIDVADALRLWLNGRGHSACARPLPPDLEGRLPLTRVTKLSGNRSNVVVDAHRVQLETWATTQAEAMAEAILVEAALHELPGTWLGGVPCYAVSVYAAPHDSHDPDHPDLCVAETFAEVVTRAVHT